MRKSIALFIVVVLAVATRGDAQETGEDRLQVVQQAERVRFTDRQGVTIEAAGFGKLFAMAALDAFYGDSQVQIPFERIASMTNGEIRDSRMTSTIRFTSGKTMTVQLDATEYGTVYGGEADFGYFRIRLQDVRQLEFLRPERAEEAVARRCRDGHLFYNELFRFCPYDGAPLAARSAE